MPFSSRSTVCPWSVHCSFGPNGQEDPHASRIQTCDQISINPVCEVAIKHNVLNLFYRNYVPCTVDSWLSDPVLPSKGDRFAVCLNSTLLSRGCKSKSNLKQLSLGRIGCIYVYIYRFLRTTGRQQAGAIRGKSPELWRCEVPPNGPICGCAPPGAIR